MLPSFSFDCKNNSVCCLRQFLGINCRFISLLRSVSSLQVSCDVRRLIHIPILGNISDGLLGSVSYLYLSSPEEERLEIWFWLRKILSCITGCGQKSRLVWEPQSLALSSENIPKRAWHGWVFPKQSCRRGQHLVELIACNFPEVIAEWQWLQHSRDQKGGDRFYFFQQKLYLIEQLKRKSCMQRLS